MGFTVDPQRLDRWSVLLGDLVDDADRAAVYARGHVQASDIPGPFHDVTATVAAARDALDESARHVATLMGASSSEMRRTADNYRNAELAELARIDAAFGDLAGTGPGSLVPDRAASVPLEQRADPAGALVEPAVSETIPGWFNDLLAIGDNLSAAHWIGELLEAICGVNPYEDAVQFLGDWRRLSRTADACRHLADFDLAMAAAIGGAADDVLATSWRGEAADAAGTWFAGTADALDAHAPALRRFAGECDEVARIMDLYSGAIVDGLKGLVDFAIGAGVTALAAAAGPATAGVSWLVALAAAGITIANAVRTFLNIVEKVGQMYAIAKGLVGLGGLVLPDLQALTLRRLPAGAYDHPGV